jgi:RIO kinase 1
MPERLAPLLHDGVIDEVYTRLKSGKEADIHLVRHGGEVVAAKIYKERHARNFKNNAAYLEGRRTRNTRTQRAIDKGSRFGQAAAEQAWKAKESEALFKLHAAGLRVPKPVLFYEGVLLMEAVLDSDGRPAPRLVEAAITRDQAGAWYADLRAQVVRMLCAGLIHGDLSPYNVLVAWNGPTIIDFPQVIEAAANSQAERFFERDLENLRRFFAQHDPALHARSGDAREIWRTWVRRELTPDFVPEQRAAAPGIREFRPERSAPAGGGAGGPAGGLREFRPDRRDQRPHGRRPEGGGRPPGHGARPEGGGRPQGHGARPGGHGQGNHGQRPTGQGPGGHGHGARPGGHGPGGQGNGPRPGGHPGQRPGGRGPGRGRRGPP